MSFYRTEPEYNPDNDSLPQAHERSHQGRQFPDCDCEDCEDTRERLKVSLLAMADFGAEADICRCDQCRHWIVDGAPENGRLGRMYLCPTCYSEKIAAIQTVDFHDEVRR